MHESGPFHEGALAVQERTGERTVGASRAPMIARTLSAPAQAFLAQQRVVAAAVADADGYPWASLWMGSPGFARAVDAQTVRLDCTSPIVSINDPVPPLLTPGSAIGLLAIDLATRRRLRINGEIASLESTAVVVATREVFPNCPKYIQRRDWIASSSRNPLSVTEQGQQLDATRVARIAELDTLFVASRHPARGVDVSHRGGSPGFVRVLDAHTLRIPDYPGNSMFQTLGNFDIDPRAGVLLVDFERGRFLSIAGQVRVTFGQDDPGHPSGGTGRYWQLDVRHWVDFPMRGDFQSRLVERSPFNPTTAIAT